MHVLQKICVWIVQVKTFDLKDFTVDAYGKNFTFPDEKEVDKFINFSIESEIEVELLADGFFFENASN